MTRLQIVSLCQPFDSRIDERLMRRHQRHRYPVPCVCAVTYRLTRICWAAASKRRSPPSPPRCRTSRPASCGRSASPQPHGARFSRMRRRSPSKACRVSSPPAGTASWHRPARRRNRLDTEINRALREPEMKQKFLAQGMDPRPERRGLRQVHRSGNHQMGRRDQGGRHQGELRIWGAAGAGEGNRTLVFSLEGCCSTIELHPRRGGQMNRIARALSTRRARPVASTY